MGVWVIVGVFVCVLVGVAVGVLVAGAVFVNVKVTPVPLLVLAVTE